MRSLPPAILRSSPYCSTLHSASMPAAAKARLNATRCPSRSVSTSTPSQSKIKAFMESACGSGNLRQELAGAIRSAELRDLLLEELLQRFELRAEHVQRLVLFVLLVVVDEAVDEDVLQVRRDVDLGATELDALLDDFVVQASAAVQSHRCVRAAVDLADQVELHVRLALVVAVRRADGCRERREVELPAEFLGLVRIGVVDRLDDHVVLDAVDLADFGFDADAGLRRDVHDLLRLLEIDVERLVGPVDHDGGP